MTTSLGDRIKDQWGDYKEARQRFKDQKRANKMSKNRQFDTYNETTDPQTPAGMAAGILNDSPVEMGEVLSGRQKAKNTFRKIGKGVGKVGMAIAPYAENIMNQALIKQRQELDIPKKDMLTNVNLERVNYDPAVSQALAQERVSSQAIDRSLRGSNERVAANIAKSAGTINQASKLKAEEAKTNVGISQKEAMLNKEIEKANIETGYENKLNKLEQAAIGITDRSELYSDVQAENN
jgi:hypothetical protein